MKALFPRPGPSTHAKTKSWRIRGPLACAFLAAALLFQGSLPPAHGTTVLPPDFDSLVGQAEVIFSGKVTAIRSEWTGEGSHRRIVSFITFDVLDRLKGNPPSPYVLRVLGGTVDGETMEVSDAPKFTVGESTLLFVQNNGTQFIPLVGIMHGFFQIAKDPATGGEIILKHDGKPLRGIDEIDRAHRQSLSGKATAEATAAGEPSASPMSRSEFENKVRQKLSGQ